MKSKILYIIGSIAFVIMMDYHIFVTNMNAAQCSENIFSNEVQIIEQDEMVRVNDYIPDIVVDIRYATTNNFTGEAIYQDGEAYLRYGTIQKLARVQEQLTQMGYKIVIWDAYRPAAAQFWLWEVCPDTRYVANPNDGYSSHTRGNTVDIGIVALDGSAVQLPSEFDDFSELADRDYSDVSEEAKNNAKMLENIMTECGFQGYQNEWWHYTDTIEYEIKDAM